jgi:hypothetical protein
MNRATPFAALAVLCLAAAARAEEPAPPTGQLADGAVLEIAVQDSLAYLGTGSGSSGILLGAPSGRFFVGRKVGRLVVGAGLELTRVGFSSSGSTSSSSSSQTQLSFVPGLRYAMATSADQRVELLGLVNLGIGHTFTSTSSASGCTWCACRRAPAPRGRTPRRTKRSSASCSRARWTPGSTAPSTG